MGADLYIRNCTTVDATSRVGQPRRSISIIDGRIADIHAADTVPPQPSQRLIEGAGHYVVPALWDVHCHPGTAGPRDLTADRDARLSRILHNLRRSVAHGVCGARMLGEAMHADVHARDQLISATDVGLSVSAAGPALKPTGGHGYVTRPTDAEMPLLVDQWGSIEADDPHDLREHVKILIGEHGVDWIKIFVSGGIAGEAETHSDTHMSPAQVEAVCLEAGKHRVPVAAHAGNPSAVEMAVRGGVTSIEHGYEMTPANVADLAAHGTWYVPTISITHNVDRMRLMGWSEQTIAKAEEMRPVHRRSLDLARAAGVKIANGSDMRPTGAASVEEVLMLRDCGYPAWEALRIATEASAALCGAGDHAGTVEVGKHADLLILNANPLVDLNVLTSPTAVINRGRQVIP